MAAAARGFHRLGKVQFQIMQVLWRRERATAREITDDLNDAAAPTVYAHSTVQTLLRELERKGTITHDTDERTFIYRALYGQEEATEYATRDFLARIFDGSTYGLVAHLLQHEPLSDDERERLRALIAGETNDTDDTSKPGEKEG